MVLGLFGSGVREVVTGLSSDDRWYSIDEVRWSRSGIQILVFMYVPRSSPLSLMKGEIFRSIGLAESSTTAVSVDVSEVPFVVSACPGGVCTIVPAHILILSSAARSWYAFWYLCAPWAMVRNFGLVGSQPERWYSGRMARRAPRDAASRR